MAERRDHSCKDSKEVSALGTTPTPGLGNTGRQRQESQDKSWKHLCLLLSLLLLLTVITLSLIFTKVLKLRLQVQEEVVQLKRKVAQGLADAGHDRDVIRGQMFLQMEAVRAGNDSSCLPCLQGWKPFQGSCYSFSSGNLTWTQANESCAQKQAHLVIINSRAEQDFLTSTGQVTSWIGLFREDEEGAFRWIDGSAITYKNWDSAELSGDGPAPACVRMLPHGPWSSSACTSAPSIYICETRQRC